MPVLIRDYETRSALDLKKVGAARYAADPGTDALCAGFAADDGPVQIWYRGDPVPPEFIEAARNPDWIVVAHNDAFERVIEQHILGPRHGFPLVPVERHRCTMAAAQACALPAGLDKLAEALGLPLRKDAEGKRLMRLMAKPRKPRKDEDPNGGPYWHDAPEQLERLGLYCKRDVELERELYHRLPPLTDAEQALWVLDATINARGFFTDGALLEAASRIAAGADQATREELARITDGALTSTDQVEALQAWLAEHGCEVKDIQKPTLGHALRRKGLDPAVRRVLELRLGAAHAAAAKIDALRAWRGADGRVRGTLKFHGAGTGRWTGHGPQPQNFKRDSEDLEVKLVAVATGELLHVAGRYPQPLEVVGDIARAMICAAPGHRLLIGDFSGIESRVLAHVAGETIKLAQWREFDETGNAKLEPYYLIGRACGLPEEIARDKGKVADLAFGYMGSVGAWDKLAPEDDASSESDKRRYQQTWRSRHPRTVAFWREINSATIKALRRPGETFTVTRLSTTYDGSTFLRIVLPSGRALSYPFPRLEMGKYDNMVVVFKDSTAGKFADCRFGQGAWPGLWTENIVQAVARDLLAAAMLRLEAAGYPIALHVHDEIVCEVPNGFGSLDEFKQLLIQAPDWAADLPIAAKVREGDRFSKPSSKADSEPIRVEVSDTLEEAAPPDLADTQDDADITNVADEGDDGADLDEAIVIPGAVEGLAEIHAASPPPSELTFEQVWAAFNTPRPDEAPAARANGKGNGHDPHAGSGNAWDSGGPAGNGHGERDTGQQAAFYTYHHADGSPYLGVKRTSTKQFPQYHWTGTVWVKGAPQGVKIPYRLPELIKAPLDTWVIIAAGEKDADSAAALGFIATTNPEGERKGAWVPELNAWFAGRQRVAIMEDNDKTGYAHALEVANALRGIVPDIRIVQFRELPAHGDLTDWIEQGHSRADLLARIEAAKADRPTLKLWNVGELLGSGVPPPRGWLYGRQLCRGFLSGLVAPGDAGKTTLRLTQAIELATGRELLGHRIYKRCRVLVVSLEDDHDELWRRLLASCIHHNIDRRELDGWLLCTTINGPKLVERVNGERQLGALDGMLREAIEVVQPDLVILDPFVKLHALVENDNPDMDFVCAQLVKLASEFNIAVDCPAHTRKGELEAGNSDNRRGASAQRDAGRLDYTLTHMTEDEAKRFSINSDARKDYVRLDRAKANIVRRSIKASWFRMVSVALGNATEQYPDGDDVQALEGWTPPETWAGITEEMIDAILDDIDVGMPNGQRYSDANAAKERAVWRVVMRHCPDRNEAQCREIIKTWTDSGILFNDQYDDPIERKLRKGLHVDAAMRRRDKTASKE